MTVDIQFRISCPPPRLQKENENQHGSVHAGELRQCIFGHFTTWRKHTKFSGRCFWFSIQKVNPGNIFVPEGTPFLVFLKSLAEGSFCMYFSLRAKRAIVAYIYIYIRRSIRVILLSLFVWLVSWYFGDVGLTTLYPMLTRFCWKFKLLCTPICDDSRGCGVSIPAPNCFCLHVGSMLQVSFSERTTTGSWNRKTTNWGFRLE